MHNIAKSDGVLNTSMKIPSANLPCQIVGGDEDGGKPANR
jgi:hypothetical protein